MSKDSELLKLAKKVAEASCMDYPVQWIANEILRIVREEP